MKPDVVIGSIDNYKWESIRHWLYSLIKCGFSGKIALIAYRISPRTLKRLRRHKVIIFQPNCSDESLPIDYSTWTYSKVLEYRHYHIWQFLKEHGPENFGRVIITDVKDMIFQTNPARWLHKHMEDYDIVASSEGMTYEDEGWSRENIISRYGEDIYKHFMKDKAIMCAGLIAGTPSAIMALSFSIYLKIKTPEGILFDADQSAFNILIRENAPNYKIKFSGIEDGWACHAGTVADPLKIDRYRPHLLEGEPIWKNGAVLTPHGEKYCVVHQYDRVPEWNRILRRKYSSAADYVIYKVKQAINKYLPQPLLSKIKKAATNY